MNICLAGTSHEYLSATARFFDFLHIEVVGICTSLEAVVDQTTFLQPDLLLVDIALLGEVGLPFVRRLKGLSHKTRVVILASAGGKEYIRAARESGADGFIRKEELGKDLYPMIQELFSDQGG